MPPKAGPKYASEQVNKPLKDIRDNKISANKAAQKYGVATKKYYWRQVEGKV